jgi:transposase
LRRLRHTHAAAFPDGLAAPVQYGKRLSTVVLYLLHYQLPPKKRPAEAMAHLFGVHLVTATIAPISQVSIGVEN